MAALVAGWLVAGERAEAQYLGLSISNSASSILVSNSLTYTIIVTNFNPELNPIIVVSNVLPASVQFLSATADQGSLTNYGSTSVFYLGQVVPFTVQMTLTVRPTVAGSITNNISAAITNFPVIPAPLLTNIVTQVTNAPTLQADLAVTMTASTQTNVVNDWITYGITARNLGPSAASGVFLTNTLPPGVIFKSVSPDMVSVAVGSNRVFNLGTFNNGRVTNLQFTVQPTNAGILKFSASIGSSSTADPNLTNNFASTNIPVINYLSGPLFVVTNSPQTINLQNGLTEQSILVSNNSGTNVAAVRVIVTGLTKKLFNGVGINNGNPYVVLNTGLAAGQSVKLLLQFSPRGNFPLANSQLQAFAVPVVNYAPPAPASTSKLLNISRIVPLANGTVLIEFPTVLGKTYTIVYGDSASFSNTAIAPPAIVAPANQTQWIDYGPPTTTSAPTNSSARFYRVFQNP
ncbi:MAG: DUF11 domain-containing protein [Limisphaerales bacterium]